MQATRRRSTRRPGHSTPAYLLYVSENEVTQVVLPRAESEEERRERTKRAKVDDSSGRGRDEPYEAEDGASMMFDMVSMGRCDVIKVQLLRMQDLRSGEDRECPIGMADFDKCTIDTLDDITHFFPGSPELCIALLPCGHKFSLLPLMYHSALGSMRCPICRAGVDKPMRPSCIPQPLRAKVVDRIQKISEQENRDMEQSNASAIDSALQMNLLTHDHDYEFVPPEASIRMSVFLYSR